jgi:hypothetical protein
MKPTQLSVLLLASAIPTLFADAPAQPAKAASAGLLNDWLRTEWNGATNWDVGGQFRARYEYHENYGIAGMAAAVDFAPGIPNNSYLLLREKVHLGYQSGWFGVYGEARDSSSHEDKRNPNPEADTFDLHQGYVTLGNPKEFPLVAKVGRQELSYGDERLVGAFDWNNLGRVFDAAKLRYGQKGLSVDAFSGRVVLPNDDRFNQPNYYDWFSGVYASTKAVPRQVTDLYFLARNVQRESVEEVTTTTPSGAATARDIYTIGLRVKSLPNTLKGFDYDGEFAGQFGDFAGSATGERLDHRAFAAHLGGGYTISDCPSQPRLGIEYNFASGDSDPTDGKHETFENLFPTNHKFYGYMDFFSWQNLHNVRFNAALKPLAKLTLTVDYHLFWLADTQDYFYQVNGAPRRTGGYGINPDAGSFVGSEIDVIATYALTKFANLQAGFGHFFTGDYVDDTLANPQDANFVYVQAVLNF